MKKTKVSIIVPAYNVEKFIEKCLNSMMKQTYKNCEFIVVNDGSKDNTENIVSKLIAKDKRIILINQKNAGVSAARNKGISQSTGEYIIFVDADDYLAQDYVEYMMELIHKNEADFAYSTKSFTKSGEEQTKNETVKSITSDESVALLLSTNVIVGCWNKIYKKELLVNNNLLFLTNLFYGEGLSFIIRVSQAAKKIVIGNRKVYYYRKNNENSATTKYNVEKYRNGEKALKLIGESINCDDEKVKSMYLLHLAIFYLGAIAKIIENKKVKEYKEDYKNWKKGLSSNAMYLLTNSYVSLYRKLMIIGGLLFPHIIAYLDKKRSKKIFSKSV